MSCGYVPTDTAFLGGVLSYIDCQAQTIGEQGYLALAAPGSVASLVLTALLTILVALVGYRLLLGHIPDHGEGVLTLVKIGIVVALATSWPAYRTLFYDVALHGPAELSALIGIPSGLPGAGGGLANHLDFVDQQYQQLATGTDQFPTPFQPQVTPQAQSSEFNATTFGTAREAYLIGAITAFGTVRLTAGLLLALGPLFVAFLLFDSTRGLFEGWVCVLAGAALGALATTIILGIELALLEPWLADLIARRNAGVPIVGNAGQLLAASLMFDIVLLAVVGAIARVAWGLRLSVRRSSVTSDESSRRGRDTISASTSATMRASFIDNRSRAAMISDAIAVTERREIASSGASSAGSATSIPTGTSTFRSSASSSQDLAFASPATRRTGTRVSASAGLRDKAR